MVFIGLQLSCLIQVAQLRQRFFHSISPGGLAGDRRGVVPASGFSFSAQQIWKVIKENKDLDLPAHKVLCFLPSSISVPSWKCRAFTCIYLFVYQIMVATVRCEEISNEKLSRLTSDKVLIYIFSVS